MITAQYLGKIAPARIPDGVRVLPTQVSIAAQLPQATGLAWGLRLQGEDAVVMAYIGEGGSSEGDFHEALNLAGVTKVADRLLPPEQPVGDLDVATGPIGHGELWFRARGTVSRSPGRRQRRDGVYEVAVAAVERARKGEGPTLIESVTYRMSFHNTTDNPSKYEDPKEHEEARTRDPIERVQKYLTGIGLWDKKREAALTEELTQENEAALSTPSPRRRRSPRTSSPTSTTTRPSGSYGRKHELLDGRGT